MPPTRPGPGWRRLPRRCTTAASPRTSTCARMPMCCGSSTGSISLIRDWCISRSGGLTRPMMSRKTRASSGFSSGPAAADDRRPELGAARRRHQAGQRGQGLRLLAGRQPQLPRRPGRRQGYRRGPAQRAHERAGQPGLPRAGRFLAANGIRQFLDIGSGIPTEGNVHEIAQRADPDARIVYADVDPVAVAHSRAILDGNQGAAVIEADLREPAEILRNATVRGMIEFAQPVGLLLVAVLHFLADADDPWRIVATLRDALAPGSYLAICHGTSEGTPVALRAAEKVYNRSVATSVHVRPRAGILRFFDGFDLVDPGLFYIPEWRGDSPQDMPKDPSTFWGLVGVGRKP